MRIVAVAFTAILMSMGLAHAQPAPNRTSPPSTAAPSRSGTDQFTSEADAKAHCSTGNVVWLNAKSKVYHFAGTRNYGKTKSGVYMCQADADRVGRAAKNEKPPAH
jgi:hypothetical protein